MAVRDVPERALGDAGKTGHSGDFIPRHTLLIM
jgi:hypothetical protein